MAERTTIRIKPNLLDGMKLIKLHSGQMKVARSTKRFKVVVAGRRWGKTHFSGTNLLKHALKKQKALVWYVAPTYGMAKDIMWDTLLEIIPEALIAKKNETKLSIRLINGSQIQLKGADKPDTLRGRGVDYVVLDEYQDFKSGTWEEVIFPTLTDKRGQALIIGTPKAYNHLYELYRRGQDHLEVDWDSWQFPTASSPFIPRKEIETARRNLDPRTFRQEYEACHIAGTKVALWQGGSKSVEFIVPGDQLCYLAEDGFIYPTIVEAAGSTGEKECLFVELENGEVFEASTHHKMKVQNAKF